jgi:hypothetical protein
MRYTLALAALAFLLDFSGAAARTWRSISGEYSVEAEFVSFKEGQVRLRRTGGRLITVPLEKLSPGDQQYVRSRAGRPSADASRTWTSNCGRYTTEAAAVSVEMGTVWLRKVDGTLIAVPLGDLSEADQKYIRALPYRAKRPDQELSDGVAADNSSGGQPETNGPQTVVLQLRRLEQVGRSARSRSPSDAAFRRTYPQSFSMQIGRGRADARPTTYARFVKKEPTEFHSEYPLRGVATLGTAQYGFVLDKAEPAAPGYGRLYFDVNHNGDLTDDSPIEVEPEEGGQPDSYSWHCFPRVDLRVPVGQTETDYAFFFTASWRKSSSYEYVSAMLNAAAYLEGNITLNGKQKHLVLLDLNSNGRFDDRCEVLRTGKPSGGEVYLRYGDTLLVGSNQKDFSRYGPTIGENQQYLSELVKIDGQFYKLEISATADRITLTPDRTPVGYVTNPNEGFRGTVYGDKGVVGISGAASGPIQLPVGEWRLLAYTINRPTLADAPRGGGYARTPYPPTVGQPARSARSQPTYATVSARCTGDYKPVRVGKAETVVMPFGPPYKPVVKVVSKSSTQVQLSLSIVGSAGEICNGLTVNGRRPPNPEFTICTPTGDEIEKGKFEYG